jgi:serine/threonine protein kinase
MEFCDGGTLQKHVESRKQRGFSVLRIAGYVAQLADGLEFIHSKNVAHRDLKSENVMMTSTMQIKISDFGCGKTLPQGSNAVMTMTGGDMMIIPPEMAHRIQGVPAQGQVGPAYDMWGCGVILAEMVTLQLMRKDICKSKPLSLNKPAEDKILSDAKRNYGGKFYNLLSNLLQHNPDRRWSARQVRNEVKSFLKSEHKASDGQTLKKVAAQLGVPESQLAEAWTNFQTADTHGKGAITVGQLKALLTLLHIDVSSRALMERFDADKSGTMDFKEFATFWLQRNSSWMPTVVPGSTSGAEDAIMVQRVYGIPAGDFQKLKAAFQNYDTDRSGDVTAIGMWTVLQTAGVNMGSDFQSYLDRVGPDHNTKTFTFDDILHWTKNHVDWTTHTLKSNPSSPSHHSARPGAGLRPSGSSAMSTSGHSTSAHSTSAISSAGSSKHSSGISYQVNQRVWVKRTSGDWAAAKIQQVTNEAYVVLYTETDKGSTKSIKFSLAAEYLRPRD